MPTYSVYTNADIFRYILNNLEFDQLIWEYGTEDDPDWVHVSFVRDGVNRGRCLRACRDHKGKNLLRTNLEVMLSIGSVMTKSPTREAPSKKLREFRKPKGPGTFTTQAFSFDGTDDLLLYTSDFDISNGQGFSISFWVKDGDLANKAFLSKRQNATTYWLLFSFQGKLSFTAYSGEAISPRSQQLVASREIRTTTRTSRLRLTTPARWHLEQTPRCTSTAQNKPLPRAQGLVLQDPIHSTTVVQSTGQTTDLPGTSSISSMRWRSGLESCPPQPRQRYTMGSAIRH